MPGTTDESVAVIENLAQVVINARALYPDSSLAALYNPLFTPPELIKAHKELDRVVMKLYGFPKDATEANIVAALMARRQAIQQREKDYDTREKRA